MRKLINKLLFVSKGVKKIGKHLIENPQEWQQGKYEYVNKKDNGIRIWTCNGIAFININGFNGLNLSEKIYINNCIKMSIANKLFEELK